MTYLNPQPLVVHVIVELIQGRRWQLIRQVMAHEAPCLIAPAAGHIAEGVAATTNHQQWNIVPDGSRECIHQGSQQGPQFKELRSSSMSFLHNPFIDSRIADRVVSQIRYRSIGVASPT
jgi:hypothetical protein